MATKKNALLKIGDRLSLTVILPETGAIGDLRLRKEIMKKTEISETEAVAISLKFSERGVATWDEKQEPNLKADFSEPEAGYIKDCLVKLSSEKKLHAAHVDLYEQFVK